MPHSARGSQRLSLLLVDDYVPQRDLYELVLEREFDILTATRGNEAFAMAVERRPDLILLDVMMPGLDGWETCAQLKSHPATSDIPVVMLTSLDGGDLFEHGVAVGASAVVTKPCPAEKLCHAIYRALSERSRMV